MTRGRLSARALSAAPLVLARVTVYMALATAAVLAATKL